LQNGFTPAGKTTSCMTAFASVRRTYSIYIHTHMYEYLDKLLADKKD